MKPQFYFYLLLLCMTCIQLSGQREITFERFEGFPQPNIFEVETLRVKKYNRSTYVLDGTFNLKEDVDGSFDCIVVANNFMAGQYKKIVEKKFVNFCKSLWDPSVTETYMELKPATNWPEHGSCPFNAGKYWIKNMNIKELNLLPAYLPGGEQWRIDFIGFRGEEMVGGFNIYLKITQTTRIG